MTNVHDVDKRAVADFSIRLRDIERECDSLTDQNIFLRSQLARAEERLEALSTASRDERTAHLLRLLSTREHTIESLERKIFELQNAAPQVRVHPPVQSAPIPAPIVSRPSLSQRTPKFQPRDRTASEQPKSNHRRASRFDPTRSVCSSLDSGSSYRTRRALAPSDMSNRVVKN